MKNFQKIIPVFVVLLLASQAAFAQSDASSEARSGSVYSSFGVGQPVDNETAGAKAYGVFGLTSANQEIFGLQNPGLWGYVRYTQGSTGADVSNYRIESASDNSTNTNFEATQIHLLFPLKNNKLGLSVALYPVTRAAFDITSIGTFESEGTEVTYNNEITSYGGINKFEAGFGYRITDNISVGYAPSVAFLALSNSENFTFNTALFSSQSQTTKITGAAFSQRFGISARFFRLFAKEDQLSIGATYSIPYTIGAKASLTTEKIYNGTNQTIDLSSSLNAVNGDIELPMEVGLGIEYAPSRFTNLSGQMMYQQWNNYSNNLMSSSTYSMSNRLRLGFGGQYHPYKRGYNSFFSRFKYSAGLSYDSGHLVVQNEEINTLWINTGLGIITKGLSTIDLSLRYGFRGTTESNLIEERIWSFGVTVNLAELMFIRPKLR